MSSDGSLGNATKIANMTKLSIVWASRDDDYANGVNNRLLRSIQTVQESARALKIELDLVVVDWNSPDGRGLRAFFESNGVSGIRIIEVPNESVQRHPHHTGKHFEEYLAKNIGIRRALGDQIAVVNSDVVLSKDLLRLCVDRNFLEDSFLRADRLDVRIKNGRVQKKLRLNVRHGLLQSDKISIQPKGLLRRLQGSKRIAGELLENGVIFGEPGGVPHHFLLGMHTNAAGDFIATSRKNWFASNGFSEANWGTTMGDALMVARLTSLKLRQIIAPGPAHLFHEDHPSDPTRGGTWNESMWPNFQEELVSVARGNLRSAGESHFGLNEVDLPEYRL
jgi:hypothetical protein